MGTKALFQKTDTLSVDRNGSRWIARSTAVLPDLAIPQEQIAVY
jgi:hypothetical protein